MLKYTTTMITFEEIPDRVSLSVNISNCLGTCPECHTPELRLNIGTELTKEEIDRLMNKNSGVNCFLFLGEGQDHELLLELSDYIHSVYNIETALYSGRAEVEPDIYDKFDFVKVGPYIGEYGPLNKETTNQRLYYKGTDITYKFWNRL